MVKKNPNENKNKKTSVIEEMQHEALLSLFRSKMPEVLYMTPFELHDEFSQVPAEMWEAFLDDHTTQIFIDGKLSKILEVNARKALQRLAKGNFAPQEVSGIKELLERSKLMRSQNKRPRVVLSFIPPKNPKPTEEANV